MPTGIERTQPSTTPWTVCKLTSGKPRVRRGFVTRHGVTVSVKALKGTSCATVSARVGSSEGNFGEYTALQPPSRACDLPYPLVNAEVAGGLGITGLKSTRSSASPSTAAAEPSRSAIAEKRQGRFHRTRSTDLASCVAVGARMKQSGPQRPRRAIALGYWIRTPAL